jgi:hypothetical protein
MACGCFLMHAPRVLIEASMEAVERLAPRRGPCHGVVEAAQ